MNKLLTIIIISLTLSGCHQNSGTSTVTDKNAYILSGKLTGLANDTIFLMHRTDEGTIVDTSIAKSDSFSFSGVCTEPRVYVLRWFKNSVQGKIKVSKEIFLEQGVINVTGNIDSTEQKIAITGSGTQKEYEEFLAAAKPFDDKMDSLENLSNSLSEEYDKKELETLDVAFNLLNEQKKTIAASFIAQHKNSQVASFMALRYFATESASVGQLDSIFQSLEPVIQNGYYGKQLSSIVKSLKQTEIGMAAPGFTLTDTGGHAVSLASFKGKVVLIDFWASWCGPCRRENPNVVKAYKKFHPKGFEILGVSLDEKRDKWIAAIEKDHLEWQQVSDLKGWGNSVAQLYVVRSIPNNYLLDKNGNIIAKTLHGDELTKKLEETLK